MTKINANDSTATAFIIWKYSITTWKCEYYCIKNSDLTGNVYISENTNLHSALKFWSDLLASVPGRVVVITDARFENSTTDIRVTTHEIQVTRARKGLERLRITGDGESDAYLFTRKYFNAMNDLKNGTEKDRQRFKEHIQKIKSPNSVHFERVVIS